MRQIVAIDIGGTHLRVAVFLSDVIKPKIIRRTPARGKENGVFERLTDLIDLIWPKEPVDAISVAVPGLLNATHGRIISTPNIPAWKDFSLADELGKRYHVPVYLGNDANLAALGEWKHGAGRGHHDILYLTISTGIGGGIICRDILIEGSVGIAGELGHITVLPGGPLCSCGIAGHLEAVASGPAIVRYVVEQCANGKSSILSSKAKFSATDVADAARQGDLLAIESFNRAGGFIGQAVADFLHIMNPSMVIFGGGVSQSGKLILDPIKEAVKRNIMDQSYLDGLQLVTAELGDEAGLIGALVQAQDRLSKAG
jgi:glucokinase